MKGVGQLVNPRLLRKWPLKWFVCLYVEDYLTGVILSVDDTNSIWFVKSDAKTIQNNSQKFNLGEWPNSVGLILGWVTICGWTNRLGM